MAAVKEAIVMVSIGGAVITHTCPTLDGFFECCPLPDTRLRLCKGECELYV